MKLAYTHENIALVTNIQQLLEQAGIETVLKNEFSGSGRGELGVFDTWPEVWVVSDQEFPRAEQIVESVSEAAQGPDWVCGHCGESNGPAFAVCWHCQSAREAR